MTAGLLSTDPAATAAADAFLHAAHTTLEGRRDPYRCYAGMRQVAPLYRSGLDGIWYATRYADVKAILHDPRAGRGRFRPAHGVTDVASERFNRRFSPTMILQNPPAHTRLRGMARAAFSAHRIKAMRPRIEFLVGRMLDGFAEQAAASGSADIVRLLAFPLPVAVIAELVGVPREDSEYFRGYLRAFLAGATADAAPADIAAADTAAANIDDYLRGLVAQRRACPRDDLITALAEVRDAEGRLTDAEITSTAFLLFAAGFVTTTHLIGNGLLALLRHPAEHRRLWADPALIGDAIEEMLRYDSPAQFVRRQVLEPMEIAGVRLAAGDDIVTLPGAANRDPARFADPDRFDIIRPDNQPLSFGHGIHHCLGAALARLEVRVVLELMIARFADLRPADPDQPPPLTTWFLRGVESLPLEVTPR